MNRQTSGFGDGVSLSIGTLLGNVEGAPLEGTLEGKINFLPEMGCRSFGRRVSLSVGVPLGNLGRGAV
jgi:hypothetical protein